jgi:hypothetical protein
MRCDIIILKGVLKKPMKEKSLNKSYKKALKQKKVREELVKSVSSFKVGKPEEVLTEMVKGYCEEKGIDYGSSLEAKRFSAKVFSKEKVISLYDGSELLFDIYTENSLPDSKVDTPVCIVREYWKLNLEV